MQARKLVLIVSPLLAMGLFTGCGTRAIQVSDAAAPQTVDAITTSEDYAAFQAIWDTYSTYKRNLLCEYFHDDPAAAWAAFSDGGTTTTRVVFNRFFIDHC